MKHAADDTSSIAATASGGVGGHPAARPPGRRSFSASPPLSSSSSSSAAMDGPRATMVVLQPQPVSAGSPLQRNMAVPAAGAVVRLHKTLSLGGEKKQAPVTLPVVPITALPAAPPDPLVRKFPPPAALLASALSVPSSSSSSSSSSTTTTSSSSFVPTTTTTTTTATSTTKTHREVDQVAPPTDTKPLRHSGSGTHHTGDRRRGSITSTTSPGGAKGAAEAREHNGVAGSSSTGSSSKVLTFPLLAQMADSEAGRASLSLCSDGTPSIHFRRRFITSEIGDSLYSILVSRAAWKFDHERAGRNDPKIAWYGDAQTDLSCAGSVILHQDWSKIPLLGDIKEKLELEFHATFNAVQCFFFRSGSEYCESFPEDALSKDTDAVFICLGQNRHLLLSPKTKAGKQDYLMGSKLPHVRVVMEINAAVFVHRAARSHYDYSVPPNEDSSLGGNILLCFRRLHATKKPLPSRDSTIRELHRRNSDQNVIYIDEADELTERRRSIDGSRSKRDMRGLTTDPLKEYVGRIFYSKIDLARLGIHKSYTSSICGNMENGADSILLSDNGAPPVDERLSYTCMVNSHENQVERAILQVNVLNDTPVRLVRRWRADFNHDSAHPQPAQGPDRADEKMWYRYDGLYSVRYGEHVSQAEGKLNGRGDSAVFCEFLLTRLPLYPPSPQPMPKRDVAKPKLPSISSLTSLPSTSYRDQKRLNRSDSALRRDSNDDDDIVEIIEVKPAQQPHHVTLPPTSSLLSARPSPSSSPMRKVSNSPPHTSTSAYPPLLPMSSPSRQAPAGTVPLPGILPYMKPQQPHGLSSSHSSNASKPTSSTSAILSTSLLPSGSLGSHSSSTLPHPATLPTVSAASGQANPPSPPSSNNLNQAMLMYSLFGTNPLQASGAQIHAVNGHPLLRTTLDQGAGPLRAGVPPPPASQQHPKDEDVAREQHAIQKTIPSMLMPALYEVPTAQLLFFMNLIPQKDREIAHIMQQREYKASKRKRKEEQQEKKRKRKKETAAQTSSSTASTQKRRHDSSKSTTTKSKLSDDLLGQTTDPDGHETDTKSKQRKRRAGAVQKKSEPEPAKSKELFERPPQQAPKRKRNRDSTVRPDQAEAAKSKESTSSSGTRRGRGDRSRKRSTEADEEGSLFCICRSPDEYGFMIACDKCNDWFHGGCVGLTPEEGQDLKTYICPRCQPANPRKKALPFGDALSFSGNGASRGGRHGSTASSPSSRKEEEPDQIDEGKVDWKMMGEVVYCGEGDMEDDFDSEDPSGFIFVAYGSFSDIAKEREEARKTREEYVKKQEQQKYLQKRLQEAIKRDQQQQQRQQDEEEVQDTAIPSSADVPDEDDDHHHRERHTTQALPVASVS